MKKYFAVSVVLEAATNANEIVCGRKHCAGCGRWRLLCDFPHRIRKGVDRGPTARCYGCSRVGRAHDHLSSEQPENLPERMRVYKNGLGRATGVPELGYLRRSVIDHVEYVFVPRAAIVAELERSGGDWEGLARRSGISARTILRIMHEDGPFVRVDVAARLAVALGKTFTLLYPEEAVVEARPPSRPTGSERRVIRDQQVPTANPIADEWAGVLRSWS